MPLFHITETIHFLYQLFFIKKIKRRPSHSNTYLISDDASHSRTCFCLPSCRSFWDQSQRTVYKLRRLRGLPRPLCFHGLRLRILSTKYRLFSAYTVPMSLYETPRLMSHQKHRPLIKLIVTVTYQHYDVHVPFILIEVTLVTKTHKSYVV